MKQTLFVFVFLMSLTLCAQAGRWQEGYVQTQAGDRLEGQLRLPAGTVTIEEVTFRTADGRIQSYRPEQLREFATAQRQFVTHRVNYNPAGRLLRKLEAELVADRIATVFLEQFYRGATDLYRYVDAQQLDHYYIGSNGSQPEYLRYQRQLTGPQTKLVESFDTYQQQLLRLVGGCEEARGAINDAAYNLPSFMVVVDAYTNCTDNPQQPLQVGARGEFSVGLTVGASHVAVSTPAKNVVLHTAGYHSAESVVPQLGTLITYRAPYRNLSLRLRTSYESFAVSEVQPFELSKPRREEYPTRITQRTLFNNVGLSYQVRSGRIPLFIDLGVLSGLILHNERESYYIYYTGQDADLSVRSYDRGADWGGSLGLGTQIGPVKLLAEASFVDRSTEILYSTRRFSLFAAYDLIR